MVFLTRPSVNSHRMDMLRLIMEPRLNMQMKLNQVRPCTPMAWNASNKLLEVSCTTLVWSITNSLLLLVKSAHNRQLSQNAQIRPSHNYSIMLPPIPTAVLFIHPVIWSSLHMRKQHTWMSASHVSVSVSKSFSQKMTLFHATMDLSLSLHK